MSEQPDNELFQRRSEDLRLVELRLRKGAGAGMFDLWIHPMVACNVRQFFPFSFSTRASKRQGREDLPGEARSCCQSLLSSATPRQVRVQLSDVCVAQN